MAEYQILSNRKNMISVEGTIKLMSLTFVTEPSKFTIGVGKSPKAVRNQVDPQVDFKTYDLEKTGNSLIFVFPNNIDDNSITILQSEDLCVMLEDEDQSPIVAHLILLHS